jgi:hypothetical protein
VWTGRSRSIGPQRIPSSSVLVALLLHCACDGENGARDQFGIVEHGNMPDVDQNFKRRLGQALTGNLAVRSDRHE